MPVRRHIRQVNRIRQWYLKVNMAPLHKGRWHLLIKYIITHYYISTFKENLYWNVFKNKVKIPLMASDWDTEKYWVLTFYEIEASWNIELYNKEDCAKFVFRIDMVSTPYVLSSNTGVHKQRVGLFQRKALYKYLLLL